jgi:hypothetical protein
MLKLDWKRHELQYPGVLQWRGPVRKSYCTVRLGAPAKFAILHSKIGRRVDFSSYKKPGCSLDLCDMLLLLFFFLKKNGI